MVVSLRTKLLLIIVLGSVTVGAVSLGTSQSLLSDSVLLGGNRIEAGDQPPKCVPASSTSEEDVGPLGGSLTTASTATTQTTEDDVQIAQSTTGGTSTTDAGSTTAATTQTTTATTTAATTQTTTATTTAATTQTTAATTQTTAASTTTGQNATTTS